MTARTSIFRLCLRSKLPTILYHDYQTHHLQLNWILCVCVRVVKEVRFYSFWNIYTDIHWKFMTSQNTYKLLPHGRAIAFIPFPTFAVTVVLLMVGKWNITAQKMWPRMLLTSYKSVWPRLSLSVMNIGKHTWRKLPFPYKKRNCNTIFYLFWHFFLYLLTCLMLGIRRCYVPTQRNRLKM